MIMCMYKRICITNSTLVHDDFISTLKRVIEYGVDIIILRETHLDELTYENIFNEVNQLCEAKNVLLVLHSFVNVAKKINHPHIHLTMKDFLLLSDEDKKYFATIGVSTHTVLEAIQCEKLGATYITASHIFETDCKKGLEPRGLKYLRQVKQSVSIPVYALGGINDDNEKLCLDAGADGICKMSYYMEL